MSHLKGIYKKIAYVFSRFYREGYSSQASALAYSSLLALVPAFIISFGVLSFFPAFQGMGDRLQKLVVENFIPTSADVVSQYLTDFLQQTRFLSPVNTVLLGIVVIVLIYNMSAAFNRIWRTKPHFHFTLAFLIYAFALVVTPLLLGVILLLSTYIISVPIVSKVIEKTHVDQPLFHLFPYLITFCVFTFFNWVLPAIRVKFRHAVLGALVTTFLFEGFRYGFVWYLAHVKMYQIIYGGLAIIPLFLMWLYISWVVILFGALVANVAAKGIRRIAY